MSHHKRRKRKFIRAGCIMCKPWKQNGFKGMAAQQSRQELKARTSEKQQREQLAK